MNNLNMGLFVLEYGYFREIFKGEYINLPKKKIIVSSQLFFDVRSNVSMTDGHNKSIRFNRYQHLHCHADV